LVGLLGAGALHAATIITVDGNDADWTGVWPVPGQADGMTQSWDGVGDVPMPAYDIDWNWYTPGIDPFETSHLFFMFQLGGLTATWPPADPGNPVDQAYVLLDTDQNPATGGQFDGVTDMPGVDYYAFWDLSAANGVLYRWNGAAFANTGVALDVAKGDVGGGYGVVEWGIHPGDVDNPGPQLYWDGVMQDTAGNLDVCHTPEPATLSVLALGLCGLFLRRRRKPEA
jgi:hypothetical protein